MSKSNEICEIRKEMLDLIIAFSDLNVAIEEFVEDPSQETLDVLAFKLKGFDVSYDELKESVSDLLKNY
jgi:hypothetical protein